MSWISTRVDPSGLCGQPCAPTTDPFCGCDPTFGPDCGGCGVDRPCRCNPAVDPTCGGPVFLRGGLGLVTGVTLSLDCGSLQSRPTVFGVCPYVCVDVKPVTNFTVVVGEHNFPQSVLIKACGPMAIGYCPSLLHVTVTDYFIFGFGFTTRYNIRGCLP